LKNLFSIIDVTIFDLENTPKFRLGDYYDLGMIENMCSDCKKIRYTKECIDFTCDAYSIMFQKYGVKVG
jgi:hypothetical protein